MLRAAEKYRQAVCAGSCAVIKCCNYMVLRLVGRPSDVLKSCCVQRRAMKTLKYGFRKSKRVGFLRRESAPSNE